MSALPASPLLAILEHQASQQPGYRTPPSRMCLLTLVGEAAYARQVVGYWERLSAPLPPLPAPPKAGRTPTFNSPKEFAATVDQVLTHLVNVNRYGKRISKSAVATQLGTSYRQLRTWEVDYQVDVKHMISSRTSPKKNSDR